MLSFHQHLAKKCDSMRHRCYSPLMHTADNSGSRRCPDSRPSCSGFLCIGGFESPGNSSFFKYDTIRGSLKIRLGHSHLIPVLFSEIVFIRRSHVILPPRLALSGLTSSNVLLQKKYCNHELTLRYNRHRKHDAIW